MARPGDMLLGPSGSEILLCPGGRRFRVSLIEEARERRSINGTLWKDIIYRKREFRLSYSVITGTARDEYLYLYSLKSELSFLHYDANGVQNAYTVIMSPFSYDRQILLDDGLYSGVDIILAEV